MDNDKKNNDTKLTLELDTSNSDKNLQTVDGTKKIEEKTATEENTDSPSNSTGFSLELDNSFHSNTENTDDNNDTTKTITKNITADENTNVGGGNTAELSNIPPVTGNTADEITTNNNDVEDKNISFIDGLPDADIEVTNTNTDTADTKNTSEDNIDVTENNNEDISSSQKKLSNIGNNKKLLLAGVGIISLAVATGIYFMTASPDNTFTPPIATNNMATVTNTTSSSNNIPTQNTNNNLAEVGDNPSFTGDIDAQDFTNSDFAAPPQPSAISDLENTIEESNQLPVQDIDNFASDNIPLDEFSNETMANTNSDPLFNEMNNNNTITSSNDANDSIAKEEKTLATPPTIIEEDAKTIDFLENASMSDNEQLAIDNKNKYIQDNVTNVDLNDTEKLIPNTVDENLKNIANDLADNITSTTEEPPTDLSMQQSEDTADNMTSLDDDSFDDMPQISDKTIAPDNVVPVDSNTFEDNTTSSVNIDENIKTANDIYVNNNESLSIENAVAPVAPEAPPIQNIVQSLPSDNNVETSSNIPNINQPATSSTGQLVGGNDENIRDSLKELPSREAIIRPLPKKYLIIKHKKPKVDKIATIKAEKALRKGNAGAALGLLEKAKKTSPQNMDVIFKQAIAYQQMGNINYALRKYEEILNKDPANLSALTNMLGLLKEKSPNLALAKLKELHEIYPDNAGITAQLSVAYAKLKHYSEAIKYLDIASGLDEPNDYYAFNKAVYLDHLGKRGEATEMYKQALIMNSRGMRGSQPIPITEIKKRLGIH